MFFTEEKLSSRLHELEKYRYRDARSISSFRFQLDEQGAIGSYPPEGGGWSTMQLGDRWKGRDLYAWLAADVDVPAEWTGRQVVGLFDFGRTGSGVTRGFESLLFINGQPYQGIDTNHQEVFLPDESVGSRLPLVFRLWSGLEGGGRPQIQEHQLACAEIAWLDPVADDLYYTAWAILDTLKILSEDRPERVDLLTVLNKSFLEIDWSYPGSDAFYQSVASAQHLLRSELAKIEKHHPVTVHCIGHTHIDVAWLWQVKHTREKAARSFSTVLRLMEKYPEYMFLQTQPQLYEYMKSDYPEIYAKIRERVKEGRWEAAGGMWLEADCNIPSGESLVRQILLGTRFLQNEFGVECTYLWLPDVFGYSWALPQILKKSGIRSFMTTKISWNQYNRMPHDTFTWRGIDGSEILTHFITTPRPGGKKASFYTYNGVIRADSVNLTWENYRDKNLNKELLFAYGYGDGGGGVNRDMLELRRRLNDLPGMPHLVTGRADSYFEGLQERIAGSDQYVHTWDGELYLEYHRGTYTSQAYNKRMNRKLELLYRETEWLQVVAGLTRSGLESYPQQALNEGWKIVLRNQFHDIIPGSSIREVYEDSRLEYSEAEKIALSAWKEGAGSVTSGASAKGFTVFNSANWERQDIVTIRAGAKEGTWFDTHGRELRAQRSGDNWLVQVTELPSMGFTGIYFEEKLDAGGKSNEVFVSHASGISSPYYEIEWDAEGQLVKLFDKTAARDILPRGAKGNVFQVFEDKPLLHDAWDIDLYYQEKMREVVYLEQVNVTEAGPIRAVVRFQWKYMNSTIMQDMILYSAGRRIDFVTKVDWHEKQQLLKVAFPIDIRAVEATYDIQFGNVKRPTHWNTSWDAAKFETVGHQWADVSEHGYGVSLLNDCKYGYDIKDNVMRLTLIKSAIRPDYEQDQGEHYFTYSLLPHSGGWLEGNTVKEAWELNNPLTLCEGAPIHSNFSLFRISNGHILIDAVKKAEDENKVVLRLHEFAGGREAVKIFCQIPVRSWQECDLLERPAGGKSFESTISFQLNPYEIKTFLIEF